GPSVAGVPSVPLEVVPLSFAQQRLWFLEQLGDLGTAYHIPWMVHLRGALDPRLLHRALNRIVARHESLRTTIVSVDGVPQQMIEAPLASEFTLVEHDLRELPEAARPAEARRLVTVIAAAPFEFAHGPLIRGALFRLADDHYTLLVTVHHIVSDAWSTGVLLS